MAYIYLMGCAGSPAVKIGRSDRDPHTRKKEFQTGNPFPIEVIWTEFTSDPVGMEAKLHEHFKDKVVLGEWFNLGDTPVIAFREAFAKYQKPLSELSPAEAELEERKRRFQLLSPATRKAIIEEIRKLKREHGD